MAEQTKVWLVNWADQGFYEAMRDDLKSMSIKDYAEPRGLVLLDIANIGLIQAKAVQDWKETYEDDFVEETWVLEIEDKDDQRIYSYGPDAYLIAWLVDVIE